MFTKYKNDIIAVVVVFIVCAIYVYPVLSGKVILQSDMQNTIAAQQDCYEHKNRTGEFPFWSNSMFSGMPTFMIVGPETGNLFRFIAAAINSGDFMPLKLLFISGLCFFFMLRAFRVNTWLALAGAIAFAFSGYNIIILEEGHITKLRTLALCCGVIGSMRLILDGRYWLGAALMALFINLQFISSHIQVSYYIFMAIGIWIVCEIIAAIKEKNIKALIKPFIFMAVATAIGTIPNTSLFMSNLEYTPSSMQGGSELDENKATKGGLEVDYAFAWSYGIMQTATLMFPYFMGSSSTESVNADSKVGKLLKANGYTNKKRKEAKMPYYWGTQDFTAGPFYFGAVVCMLFIFGIFVVEGKYKWWLIAASILSIMLAWGKNFLPLSKFFLILCLCIINFVL